VKLHSSNKQFTISVSTMPVVDASLTLSDTIQYQHVSGSKSESMAWCFVCKSISAFRFDLLHSRK